MGGNDAFPRRMTRKVLPQIAQQPATAAMRDAEEACPVSDMERIMTCPDGMSRPSGPDLAPATMAVMRSPSSKLLIAALAAASLTSPAHAKTAPAASHEAYLKPVVPFIENDYARAVAEARARKVPLFVEAWAPW